MSKKNRILLITIFDLIYIVAFDCIYGFTVGGKIGLTAETTIQSNIRYFLCAFAFTLAVLISNFAVINGRDIFIKKSEKTIMIWLAIAIVFVSYLIYFPLNTISADNKFYEYDTTVISVDTPYKAFHSEVTFKRKDGTKMTVYDWGNEKEIRDEKFSDKRMYVHFVQEGTRIHVKEQMGGFGFPVCSSYAYDFRGEIPDHKN